MACPRVGCHGCQASGGRGYAGLSHSNWLVSWLCMLKMIFSRQAKESSGLLHESAF